VRATLFHYDFTRVPSPWAARTPGAPAQHANCSVFGPYFAPADAADPAAAAVAGVAPPSGPPFPCTHWWARTKVREYVPVVDGASLKAQVVERHGWPTAPPAPRDAAAAACTRAPDGMAQRACSAVVHLRRAAAPLRRWVGVTVSVLGVPCFLDGPMLLIVAAMVVAPLARALAGRALRLGRGGTVRAVGRPSKVKVN
jgi:hypothetical protein